MITSAILYLLYATIQVIISPILLFSDVVLPEGIANAIGTAGMYVAPINIFIPVDTLVTILLLYLQIEGFVGLYKLIMWGIKKIPTIS